METLSDSLSSNEKPVLYKEQALPIQRKVFTQTPLPLEDNDKKQEATLTTYYQFEPNPLIIEDRQKALSTIEELLSAAELLKYQMQEALLSEPLCPYQQTLNEYLGPNFICPSIDDLEFPKHFQHIEAMKALDDISNKFELKMMDQIAVMSAEAMDTSFVGITSEGLGHAFGELSATADGPQYVINKQKTAQNLVFAEIVRNIPTEYILENPLIVAQKLASYYIAINQD